MTLYEKDELQMGIDDIINIRYNYFCRDMM